jgi:ABC-2 type transport system ATP-binding protein
VRLEAVGKRYGLRQPWIVRDVSREIAGGQLIKVEGRNGSGKSTLLRVAAGVSSPSAGRVTGRPKTGYVPERFPGGLAFSARDYLQHMGRIHGLSGPAVSAAVVEWLDRLGASEYAGSPLQTLSKGMCQKVAIAQALLARPDLLVLDEAWTGLDQAARGTLDAAVRERVADGGSVLFVDHDPARLQGLTSQRWKLSGGQVETAPGDDIGSEGREPGIGSAAPGHGALPRVVVEVAGVQDAMAPRLTQLDGVLDVSAETPRLRMTVLAAQSDEVLRQLLTWDGVHVVEVRADQEFAESQAAEQTEAGP